MIPKEAKANKPSVFSSSTRTGYMLRRLSYGCILVAVILLFMDSDSEHSYVLPLLIIGVVCFFAARFVDRVRVRKIERDENGNAKKKIM